MKIVCGDKIRYIQNIQLREPLSSCLINNGHDDLADQGIYGEDIEKYGLFIIDEKNENIPKII